MNGQPNEYTEKVQNRIPMSFVPAVYETVRNYESLLAPLSLLYVKVLPT